MERTDAAMTDHVTPASAGSWTDSDTLFLLNCYDIWSATPPRGCLCGDPAPAPEATA